MEQCLGVQIVNDDIVEYTENFTVHLERPVGLGNEFVINQSVTVISIADNDGI